MCPANFLVTTEFQSLNNPDTSKHSYRKKRPTQCLGIQVSKEIHKNLHCSSAAHTQDYIVAEVCQGGSIMMDHRHDDVEQFPL